MKFDGRSLITKNVEVFCTYEKKTEAVARWYSSYVAPWCSGYNYCTTSFN